MAIALGVHNITTGNGVTTLTSGSLTTTAGSTLVAVTTMGGNSGAANSYSSLTDSNSGTWTEIGTAAIATGGAGLRMFYCKGNSGTRGSGHTITFNYNQTEYPCIFFFEITGADTTNPLDQNAQVNTDTTSPFDVGPTGTLAQAAEFVVTAGASDSASAWAATGYTIDDNSTNIANFWVGAIGHKIVAATTAVSASWTTGPGSGNNAFKIATFKEAAPGTALTGSAATSAAGTSAPAIAIALAGIALAASPGTATAGSGNVSVALTGQSTTVSAGTLATSRTRSLAGQSVTIAGNSFYFPGALGTHALVGQLDGSGSSPATTSPITTTPYGSSFVLYETGRNTDTTPVATDNYGNTFTQRGTTSGYDGFGTTWTAKVYTAANGRGGANHVMTKVKANDPAGEFVMALVEIAKATALTDFTQDYATSPAANTSSPVTVGGPATLIAIWSGDNASTHNTATPGDGFSLIENYTDWPSGTSIQSAVAYKEVTAAGSYGVTWATSPTQGANLYLFAFEHNIPGAATSVTLSGQLLTTAQGTVATTRLSGQSATASAGTLTPTITRAATGGAAASAGGTLAPGTSKAASGSAATSAAGTVAPALAVPASGSALTISAGTVGASGAGSASLSGAGATTAAGALTPSRTVSATGQGATTTAGTANPGATLALSGGAATSAAGTIGNTHAVVASGQVATSASGVISTGADVSTAITGQAITASRGSVGVVSTIPAAGQQIVAAAGSVTTGSDVTTALSGSIATTSAGSASPAVSKALAGSAATAATGTVTASSGYTAALSGAGATAQTGALAASFSKALAGSSVTASGGTIIGGNSNLPPKLVTTVVSNAGMICSTVVTDLD